MLNWKLTIDTSITIIEQGTRHFKNETQSFHTEHVNALLNDNINSMQACITAGSALHANKLHHYYKESITFHRSVQF